MSAYGVVLKPARFTLVLFALSVILAFIVVTGLDRYRIEKEQRILTTETRLSDTRDDIRKLTFDIESIKQLAEKYNKLSELVFIGEANRDGWVQRLDSLYRDTRLPPTLRYTLAPPQLLNPKPLAPDSPISYLNNISHHDLALEIAGIHEVELIDFINKLKSDWKTPYRVETCQIAREAEVLAGLQIKCTVHIYSLPLKP